MKAREAPDATVGKRILIFGATGAGKTTLGQRLAHALDLPAIELDAIHWLPNWTEKPVEQFREDVASALDENPEGWVLVGNYGSKLGDVALSRADTVIWLRLPFRITFWRLLKRTISRAWTRTPLWEGNPNTESWRHSFFSRDSILLFAITSRKTHLERTERRLQETPHKARIIILRSRKEVRELLASLPRRETPLPAP